MSAAVNGVRCCGVILEITVGLRFRHALRSSHRVGVRGNGASNELCGGSTAQYADTARCPLGAPTWGQANR